MQGAARRRQKGSAGRWRGWRSNRGARKEVAAALKGRTNVVDKGGSSGQEGRGLGGQWTGGRRRGRASTASMPIPLADRKRLSASGVKATGRGQSVRVGRSAGIQRVRNEVSAAIGAM
eukprot:scaffold8171_cov139-Amphora_coffeaeformis.AAC.1